MKNTHKTIYFLSPYPFGTAPSQRFRYEQYVERLKSEGFQCEFHSFINQKGWDVLYQEGRVFAKMYAMLSGFVRRFFLLFRLKKADSIFVHREMAHFGPPIFEWMAAKLFRVSFIYDFDDAIWLPNYSQSNAKIQWIKWYRKVPTIIRLAKTVTVGNQYLADYARQFNSNVMVIPTTIDMENHHNRLVDYQPNEIVIGWTGSHSTMHYLDEIVPVIKKLEQEYSFSFTIISDVASNYDLKSLKFIPWKKETEIADLAQFTIGVMPLKEDQWSKGKCGFKALQYMSLGIPSVISPVGVNKEIIQTTENGYLYSTSEELYTILSKLLVDAQLRSEIGLKGRKTIADKYSTTANYPIYLNLFTK